MQQLSLPPLICQALATQATAKQKQGTVSKETALEIQIPFTFHIYAPHFSPYLSYVKNRCNSVCVRREEAERAPDHRAGLLLSASLCPKYPYWRRSFRESLTNTNISKKHTTETYLLF